MKNNALSVMVAEQDEKLEWERLIGPLWDNRWRIAVVTGLAGVLGVAYALLATPVYQATAVVQVEKQLSGDSLLRETLDSTMGQSSATQDEVTLAKSRYVLGKTVDALGLTVRVSPDYFPVFGKGLARLSGEKPPVLNITTLTTPADMQGEALTLADKIGIMRDGHLIAHGETRSLYRHPTNRFAAEFLGRANLLPATALETTAGQGMTTVSCAGKVIGCFTYGAQRGFDKLLCIRPQHIALDADAQRSNCIVGTLRDIHWQWELTHLQFDAQGHPLRVVTTHQSRMPQIGERVPLYFAPDDAVLIED